MAHSLKPDVVFRRNRRVHLNRLGRQFSRLLAAEVCASAVVMLDTPCSEVLWRVLATQSIRQFPLHFPFVTVCHHISTGLYHDVRLKQGWLHAVIDGIELSASLSGAALPREAGWEGPTGSLDACFSLLWGTARSKIACSFHILLINRPQRPLHSRRRNIVE